MNLDSDLARDLERAIPHLPTPPATAHLTSGRRALRRRRAYAGAAGLTAAVIIGSVALSAGGGPTTSPAEPAATDTPSHGVGDIPDWAEEYGNHGPISIYPDGKLWVAPDARLIRTVEIPVHLFERTVISAYAVEAETDGEVWWSFVYRETTDPENGMGGTMMPTLGGQFDGHVWTTDFDVWVDDATAELQGRARFSDRLVRFADDTTDRLLPRAGAQIVDQAGDVDLGPDWETRARTSVAQVRYAEKTWFVVANEQRSGEPYFTPFQAEVVGASDIDGFVDYLRQGVLK